MYVEGLSIRKLIDMLIKLDLLDIKDIPSFNGRVISGDVAMMGFRLHGVLHNVIKQRECTR